MLASLRPPPPPGGLTAAQWLACHARVVRLTYAALAAGTVVVLAVVVALARAPIPWAGLWAGAVAHRDVVAAVLAAVLGSGVCGAGGLALSRALRTRRGRTAERLAAGEAPPPARSGATPARAEQSPSRPLAP